MQRIEVDGLKATLVKHRDGTLNIADLLDGGAKKSGVGAGNTPSAPLQIDIAGIKIANAQFTWRDEKSGSSTALSNLAIGTGRVQADSGKQTLLVNALSLAAKGRSGSDAFELTLEAPKLAISPEKAGGEALNLSASDRRCQRSR